MMMQLTADLDNEDLRSYLVESQPLLVRHTYVGSLARATYGRHSLLSPREMSYVTTDHSRVRLSRIPPYPDWRLAGASQGIPPYPR